MEKKQRTLNNKGFSLVELIVVIAIMAILVGVLAPQVIKYVESSKQSTDLQNLSAVRSAVEVGVTEGAISSDVTIAIDADGKNVTISGTGVAAALPAVGIETTIPLKSSGWPKNATVATYEIAKYKWKAGAATNDNAPTNDLAAAFK